MFGKKCSICGERCKPSCEVNIRKRKPGAYRHRWYARDMEKELSGNQEKKKGNK